MASMNLTLNKLVDNDFNSGDTIEPNKWAGGSTYSATMVFNNPTFPILLRSVSPKIGSIKVGGGNISTEEAKFEFTFGYHDGSNFLVTSTATGSFTVSEKDGTVSNKSCTIDITDTTHFPTSIPMACKMKVSSNVSSRVAKTTLSNFGMSIVYDRLYTITVNASPEGCGDVTGGKAYADGETATLKATAKAGYHFVKWNDGVTTAERKVTVTGDATYTAYFELDKINKIRIDTSPSVKVLTDKEDVGIIVDKTKVYG